MSGSASSKIDIFGATLDKLARAIAGQDDLRNIDPAVIRRVCSEALSFAMAGNVPSDEDQAEAIAYKIVMPVALFLSQISTIRGEGDGGRENIKPMDDIIPLRDALVQAVMAVPDVEDRVAEENVARVTSAVLNKISEFGYCITRIDDLTLEEAESIEKKG